MGSPPNLKKRGKEILKRLKREFPDAQCTLDFKNPLQLLIATILAAQCTDERVNRVTKNLFKKYKKAEDYVSVDPKELEEDIRSTGFYRNKAKSLRVCCTTLIEKHRGQVPKNLDQLVQISGIGRKTANLVLGSAYGVPGIAVDTHVKRVANRLEFSSNSDPDKIERDLGQIFPENDWTDLTWNLILHGRKYCHAKKPKCDICPIQTHCIFFEKTLAERP